MLRTFMLTGCLSVCFTILYAQAYRTAVGLRLSSEKTIGLTLQQKLIDRITLEGILQTGGGNNGQHSAILLVEQHQKILLKNLNLYYGLGAHKGWYKSAQLKEEWSDPAGLAAIAGLELALGSIVISLDAQPNLNIWGGDEFLQFSTGVSVRHVLVKPKNKKQKRKQKRKKRKKKKKKERQKKKRKAAKKS